MVLRACPSASSARTRPWTSFFTGGERESRGTSITINQEVEMSKVLNDEALDQLFRAARTHNAWLDKPVSDDTLRQVYDLMKWGPTSANSCPARFVFLRSQQAKERLRPELAPGNVRRRRKPRAGVTSPSNLVFFGK